MIKLLWPTVRPQVAIGAAKKWAELSTDLKNFDLVFCVNTTEHQRVFLDSGYPAALLEGARPGIAHTATLMTCAVLEYCSPKDIIVLASDDFTCEPGWDEHLKNQYAFEWQGALIVNDCYPKTTNIIPLPILSGAALRRLNGVVYHPAYNHFFSDQELFYVCTGLGLVKNLRGTDAPKFEHKHWSFGGRKKDEFDHRNNGWWAADSATYEKRKSLPVEEKLKLPEWFNA